MSGDETNSGKAQRATAASSTPGELDALLNAEEKRLDSARELNALISDVWTSERLPKELRLGRLTGVTVLVKDCFDLVGFETTCGASKDHIGDSPQRSASVIERIESEGAIVIAKTNMHEFCWGLTSQNPHWGNVLNPLSPKHVAGGSSGGNAASLGVGFGQVAIGTDTGGSVRVPAACCGVVGYKPTRSSLPIDGSVPLSPSLDTVGLMSRTLDELVNVYEALVRKNFRAVDLTGVSVGVLGNTPIATLLADAGARVRDIELDFVADEFGAIMNFEAAEIHRKRFGSDPLQYGPDVRLKLRRAMSVSRADAYEASERRARWKVNLIERLNVDLIVSPTISGTVPLVSVWEPAHRDRLSRFTRPFNYLDWPALALGDAQIAGPDERLVLGAALSMGGAIVMPNLEGVLHEYSKK